MPRNITVTLQDGSQHTYQNAPDDVTPDQVSTRAQSEFGQGVAHLDGGRSATPPPAAAPAGPQPSMLDRAIASPIGRGIHDIGGSVISGIKGLEGMIPFMGGDQAAYETIRGAVNKPYEAALARNRNTPGYAAARQEQDANFAGRANSGLTTTGLTDQFMPSILPTVAGVAGLVTGGSLDASNAAADTQAAGQDAYASANPRLSKAANIAGGFLAGPEGGLPSLPAPIPKQIAPSVSQLRADATTAYNAAHNSGVVTSAPSYDQMLADLNAKLAARGIDPTLHPNSTAVVKRLNDSAGTPMTFQQIDTQRRIAGHGIDASALNKGDKSMSRLIQDHIDDYVDNLKPADLVGGTNPQQAAADLNNARDLYSRSAKATTIQNLIDKAGVNGSNYTASGLENSLRVQFRKLANNDRGMARFSQAEQAAIKRVATGGSPASMNNALRYLGKFSPQGFFPAIAEMGAVGVMGPGALALPAAGFAGRVGATAMTKAAANRAVDLAALGRTATAIPVTPALQLPQLTPLSRLPAGLLGSGLLQPQRQ